MYQQFNNPFTPDPAANAHNRFPDVSGTISQPSQNYNFNNPYPNPYAQQQQSQQQQLQLQPQAQSQLQPQYTHSQSTYQQQPQSPTYGYPNSPTQGTGSGFQPSSAFGQGLLYGSSYSYLQTLTTSQSPSPQQYNNSHTATQQTSNPGYLSQFDPLTQQQQSQSQHPAQNGLFAVDSARENAQSIQNRPPHPRDFVRSHKIELESWDAFAWRQVFLSFEGLKQSWDERRREIEGHLSQLNMQLRAAWSGMGSFHPSQVQAEVTRLEGLKKQADENHDSVAASLFQMQELQEGYRQSSDIASKRRVREASNAAVQSLPDWPSLTY